MGKGIQAKSEVILVNFLLSNNSKILLIKEKFTNLIIH